MNNKTTLGGYAKRQHNLSKVQHEILIGSLLGDGCLYLGPKSLNPCFCITRSLKDKQYLIWETEKFSKYLTPKSFTDKTIFDKRTQMLYYSSCLRTACHPVFLPYYETWYPKNKKIIPKNLSLTPLILAIWLADDGSIHLGKGRKNTKTEGKTYPSRINIKLSTHGFKEPDVIFLQHLLEDFTTVQWSKYTDTSGSFLFLGKSSSSKRVLRMIDPVFPIGMERKSVLWRRAEADLFDIKKIKPPCKWCNSTNMYRNGHTNQNKQKYLCKDCRRQYV